MKGHRFEGIWKLYIRRPLPSLGLGGAAPGITVGVQPWLWPPKPLCISIYNRENCRSTRHPGLKRSAAPFSQTAGPCSFSPKTSFYRVSKLPFGMIRPDTPPRPAPLRQGCQTAAASAPCSFSPKTSSYRVSKLPFGTFRRGLKPSAAPFSPLPRLRDCCSFSPLQLQPQNFFL